MANELASPSNLPIARGGAEKSASCLGIAQQNAAEEESDEQQMQLNKNREDNCRLYGTSVKLW